MIFQLLGGIVVAGGVFAALLWSVFQGITKRGALQWAHIASAVLSVSGMATLSMVAPMLALAVGVVLAVTSTTVLFLEAGWNRVLPTFQLAFAIILILGLPFTG